MVKNFREPLSVDDLITFECLSFGSHPRAHIRWCIEGVAMDSKDVVMGNGNITTSYHQRRISSQDDGKELVCIVNNPNIPSLVLKQSHTLTVLCKYTIAIFYTLLLKNNANKNIVIIN
ncbi:uncharacterized protein CEXT_751521 [Caerostris extrusa]|uniref:Ig-like domain-containing protein n=1 Tax=Caerostris extrusa TaxID=172846 RepID=A0AAV4V6V9_CAEEX|nr:uncharacterized protein CEXT_751521 [Caerostris extrusa]